MAIRDVAGVANELSVPWVQHRAVGLDGAWEARVVEQPNPGGVITYRKQVSSVGSARCVHIRPVATVFPDSLNTPADGAGVAVPFFVTDLRGLVDLTAGDIEMD